MLRPAVAGIALAYAFLFSSAAHAMPAGAIFYSDFEDYASDFYVRDSASSPDFSQLTESTRTDVGSGASYGHFDSNLVIALNPLLVDDLEITLTLAAQNAAGASVRISWFDDDTFLNSDLVWRTTGNPVGPDEVFSRDLNTFSIPAAANGFELNLFVWGDGGSATWDELAVAPKVLSPIPEPSTALLLGLGLASLAGLRKRD